MPAPHWLRSKLAAGFQLNSQSATGLGRAFSGDAVIADNASVMARNAAAMTLFDSDQFSGGINMIDTDIEIKDISYSGSSINDVTNSSNTPVPNIYYIHKLNDQFAIGAGIYSNFGTKNNFLETSVLVPVTQVPLFQTQASWAAQPR